MVFTDSKQHGMAIQGLPDCKDVRTATIYSHALNPSGHGLRSPVDLLWIGLYSPHIKPPNPEDPSRPR